MKGITVTKIIKEFRFGGVWGQVRKEKKNPETIIHKMFETNSSVHMKKRTTRNV